MRVARAITVGWLAFSHSHGRSKMAIVADKSGNNPTDKPFTHYNRTNAGTPQATLVPQYAGERVLDITNGIMYQAVGLTNNTWRSVQEVDN
jgi:hypothetical protein